MLSLTGLLKSASSSMKNHQPSKTQLSETFKFHRKPFFDSLNPRTPNTSHLVQNKNKSTQSYGVVSFVNKDHCRSGMCVSIFFLSKRTHLFVPTISFYQALRCQSCHTFLASMVSSSWVHRDSLDDVKSRARCCSPFAHICCLS